MRKFLSTRFISSHGCRPGRFGLFTSPAPLAISDPLYQQKKRK